MCQTVKCPSFAFFEFYASFFKRKIHKFRHINQIKLMSRSETKPTFNLDTQFTLFYVDIENILFWVNIQIVVNKGKWLLQGSFACTPSLNNLHLYALLLCIYFSLSPIGKDSSFEKLNIITCLLSLVFFQTNFKLFSIIHMNFDNLEEKRLFNYLLYTVNI